jgi:hypothetical protein
MATMVKARPARRLDLVARADKIRPAIEERLEAARRGNYEILGAITAIDTTRGVMRFPHDLGLTIAFIVNPENAGAPRNKLLVVSPWEGLPALREGSSERCTACLVECDVCDKNGKKLCEAFKCGGSGIRTDTKLECDVCHGTGRMTCPVCKGTRKISSGMKFGAKCVKCAGTQFQSKEILQDLDQFVNARLGPMTILGPITALHFRAAAGAGPVNRTFELDRDESGDYMVLLLEPTSTITRAYLLGGVLKEKRQ